MNRTVLFRSASLGLGVALAIHAGGQLYAELTRPPFRTTDFFTDAPLPAATDDSGAAIAARIVLKGDILSDHAALKSRQVLHAAPLDPVARTAANAAAQQAVISTLSVAPVNSMSWLVLALLEAQMGEPTAGALKMSYFTGAMPADAASHRLRAVATTSAAGDEDIRLLAQSDVRAVLTANARLKAALAMTYREATPEGKKFLLDATLPVDPKFSAQLRQ